MSLAKCVALFAALSIPTIALCAEKEYNVKEALKNRFVSYVTIESTSNEANEACPSSQGQFQVAEVIKAELEKLGLKDIILDENCYLTAYLPANTDKDIPVIAFISHMDTSPDCSGKDVKPQFIENYDGGDIKLGNSGLVLKGSEQEGLKIAKGETIITTDGTTLLGADDKSGCAEIVTAMEYLINHPEVKHGKIYVAFTPDEEIGRGTDKFPMDRFPAKWAYTVDGGGLGELEYENFNAASAVVEFEGVSIHPGSAKDVMVNSQTLACQFHSEMPAAETPEHTDGYDGFFHLTDMSGSCEYSKLCYIIRDFDNENFEKRKQFIKDKVAEFNKKLGAERAKVTVKDSYRNMLEKVKPFPHIIELAKTAMKEAGVEPKVVPIRGGTDGASLSHKGLPCPNLFTGGNNFHGRYEFVILDVMQKAVNVIINICKNVK